MGHDRGRASAETGIEGYLLRVCAREARVSVAGAQEPEVFATKSGTGVCGPAANHTTNSYTHSLRRRQHQGRIIQPAGTTSDSLCPGIVALCRPAPQCQASVSQALPNTTLPGGEQPVEQPTNRPLSPLCAPLRRAGFERAVRWDEPLG